MLSNRITILLSLVLTGLLGSNNRDCDIVTCGNQSIQLGQSVQLWASGADYYSWYPAEGLSSINTANPIASPEVTTTYTVTGYTSGDNLVVNGDFESGNTGFFSGYTYQSNVSPAATYYVGTDAHNYHSNFYGVDHTTGSGNFMIINGAGTPNTVVWSQTINVIPNTDYSFSTWVCTLSQYPEQYLAQLQFSINEVQIGEVFKSPSNTNVWDNFYEIWNSGSATQATITILNQNTQQVGNDFGLDDITFNNLSSCESSSQLTVFVGESFSVGSIVAPSPICVGGSFELTEPQVSGGSGWTGIWQIALSESGPYNTLVNNNIPSSFNGNYLRYAVFYNGILFYSNIVQVAVFDIPVVNIVAEDNQICEGESVTLHAVCTVNSGLAIGDILCTDGSFAKPADWPVNGKTAKGVVFYIDPSGEHEWAAGLTFQTGYQWSSVNVDIPTLPNITHWRDAIMDLDGYGNTQKIRDFGNSTEYPAAWSVDFANGWYLPAAGQLNVLYGVQVAVNNSLNIVGGDLYPISNSGWRNASSTEWSYQYAIGVYSDGDVGFTQKTADYWYVRPVVSF